MWKRFQAWLDERAKNYVRLSQSEEAARLRSELETMTKASQVVEQGLRNEIQRLTTENECQSYQIATFEELILVLRSQGDHERAFHRAHAAGYIAATTETFPVPRAEP